MAEWTWEMVDELTPQQLADRLNLYETLKAEAFDGPGPRCEHDTVLLYRCDLCDEQLKADLAKYAGHTADCASKRYDYTTGTGWGKCDCDYEEDRERWE